MFKKERTYYFILGGLIFIYVLAQILQPKPLNWTESYSSEDKIPYGGYLMHALLPAAFPDDEISLNQSPIFEYADTTNPQKNWIFINKSFGIDRWETDILLSQVEQGASVFIAARTFEQAFKDSLGIGTYLNNPLLTGGSILDEDTARVNFTNPRLKEESGFPYYRSTTETYFFKVDSTLKVSSLGVNDEGNPNFIRIQFGEGELFLHSNPTLFTNYFVRDESGADYALKALSYLPERETIWDEYYKDVRLAGGSVVRYVVSEEHLSWAWFISLSGVLLFMVFRAKRKQRIIPTIEPPKNSSIEFARTIGSLYLEKGDHKLIADKKIRFFFDYIRSNLGLDTSEIDDELKRDIALRSGIEEIVIQGLFDLIDKISGQDDLTQKELKLLTERIDQFYNQSQR
ncbi:MAG: hypothetical protein JJ953_07140 [Gracilimonas sp.]|uniref:DUF4350 domain-containing protein n=1 Tax=Gracilimonas TaxID=649462 RepID=UPI001B0BA029|nr:DUF4350 domain-containing protein [Gracilimonas sp.]MBO6585864.1 hypothetical protein [Gracilimonas sp.]MBO6616861.1 hypothetical protein [Gracilimonas sp.]